MKTIKEQILEIDEQKLEIREYKKYKNGKYYSKYYDKNGNLIKETSSFKGKKITIYYIDGLKYYVQKIAGMTLISNENHQYVSITYIDNYEWTGRRYIHKKDILAENEKRRQSLDANEILNTSEILNANEKTKEQDIVKKQFYFANALNKIKKINHEMNENKKQFLKKNANNNDIETYNRIYNKLEALNDDERQFFEYLLDNIAIYVFTLASLLCEFTNFFIIGSFRMQKSHNCN